MLLEARKAPMLERMYALYGRRLLRRAFARVWVGGAPWPPEDGPSIAFLNHSAWWDPILTLYLSHDLFRRDGYGIMQGGQLERYPFFRRMGCFGASTDGIEDVRAVSAYATELLRAGGGSGRRTIWIFPQGELLPHRTPLVFRSGAARFARGVPEAPLVPVAVRYEFRSEQRPEAFVRVGEPVRLAPRETAVQLTRRLEHRLRQELALLDGDLERSSLAAYRVALEGRSSLHALYDRTFGRFGGAPGDRQAARNDGGP
jgi:1-acyl-sn-glycerol-3-phosphate acyltransferase